MTPPGYARRWRQVWPTLALLSRMMKSSEGWQSGWHDCAIGERPDATHFLARISGQRFGGNNRIHRFT
ncbi:Stability determinant [Pseudomonas cannabina]|uniref:Stability determinant n=1 Tax=Pseudomonas cannabina TaxID=86840 RepID=A0A0P9LPQ4_PSECA|nr:Stability determinant [Pseudomonas cannabina]